MIYSMTVRSISDLTSTTFVDMEHQESGISIRIGFPKNQPCPYEFRKEYLIEVNPVTVAKAIAE